MGCSSELMVLWAVYSLMIAAEPDSDARNDGWVGGANSGSRVRSPCCGCLLRMVALVLHSPYDVSVSPGDDSAVISPVPAYAVEQEPVTCT
jgi:hypothetical protein